MSFRRRLTPNAIQRRAICARLSLVSLWRGLFDSRMWMASKALIHMARLGAADSGDECRVLGPTGTPPRLTRRVGLLSMTHERRLTHHSDK